MPCSQHSWRALAVLGALLMVIFLYGPLTCASMPTPIINRSSRQFDLVAAASSSNVNNKSENQLEVLNQELASNMTTSKRERQLLANKSLSHMAKVTTVDIKNFWLSTTTVSPDDNLDNPDVYNKSIKNSVSNNNNISSSSNINNNNSNSDLVSNSNEYVLRNQTTELSILSLRLTTENYEKLGVTKKLRLTRTDRSLHTSNRNNNNNYNINHNNNNNNNNKDQNDKNNNNSSNIIQRRKRRKDSGLDRNERSANLSHITGTARKIQLYIKNRYLQISPDGTVNGTQDELNDYTILQRTTVEIGRIKIQSVATCLFLCMDTCGTVYGSKEFTDDCIFNEAIEQHHYNTYSSSYHSNPRRKLYLALNKQGQQRKIQIPAARPLGKLATYTKSLTQTVPHERVEKLIERLFGPAYIRHGLKQLCESGKSITELTSKTMKPKPKCNLKKQQQVMTKKKRNKRRCRPDEPESDLCIKPPIINHQQSQVTSPLSVSGPDQNTNKPNQLQQQMRHNRRKDQKLGGQQNQKHEKCADDDCKRNKNQKKNNKLLAAQQTSVSSSSISSSSNSSSNSSITNLKKNRQNKMQMKKSGGHQQKVLNPRKTTTTMQPTTKLVQHRRPPKNNGGGGVLKVIPTTEATTMLAILSSSTASQFDDDEQMYNDDNFISASSTELNEEDDGNFDQWDDSIIGNDDDGDDDGMNDSDEFDARK